MSPVSYVFTCQLTLFSFLQIMSSLNSFHHYVSPYQNIARQNDKDFASIYTGPSGLVLPHVNTFNKVRFIK